MHKRTITYPGYDGTMYTEDFYFNISRAEVVDMQMSVVGGYEEKIKKISAAKDEVELYKLFKEFIMNSYGVKSDDGKRFIKRPELTEAFMQSEAYSELLMELCANDTNGAEFINAVLPNDTN